jgi:uncharacterized membrane protein YdjX (TVP38/TMEM64 family)
MVKKKNKKEKSQNTSELNKFTKKYRLLILGVSLILLFIIWQEREALEQLPKLGYLGVFFLNFITNASIIFPFPGTASAFLAGSIWNPTLVGIFSGLGAGLGELFGYFLGYGGRSLIKPFKKENVYLIRLKNFFKKNAFITIFILATVPIPFFDFIGILAGAMNYPVWKFLIATIAGRVIRDVIIAWSGARIL